MRDEDNCLAAPRVNAAYFLLQFAAAHRIESREWLVHQDDVRVRGERAGNADALLLTAGQLLWVALQKRGIDAQHSDERGEPRRRFRRAPFEEAGHREYVVGRRPTRKKARRLDHIADAAPELFRFRFANVLAVDFDLSFVGGDHRIDHAQHRRFAAARRADKDEKSAARDLERKIHNRRRGGEVLRHIAQLDHRFLRARPSSISKIKFAKSASRMTGIAPTKTRSRAYCPMP